MKWIIEKENWPVHRSAEEPVMLESAYNIDRKESNKNSIANPKSILLAIYFNAKSILKVKQKNHDQLKTTATH
jgi:hypothetical protein